MIRDEFKNADKKAIDKKANKKIQEIGERAFYAKKLSLYNDLLKPVKNSTIFCLICFSIPCILYILNFVLTKKVDTMGIVIFCLTGAMIIWTIVWFAWLSPTLHKKAEFYKSEITRLNREYVMKRVR